MGFSAIAMFMQTYIQQELFDIPSVDEDGIVCCSPAIPSVDEGFMISCTLTIPSTCEGVIL